MYSYHHLVFSNREAVTALLQNCPVGFVLVWFNMPREPAGSMRLLNAEAQLALESLGPELCVTEQLSSSFPCSSMLSRKSSHERGCREQYRK